MKIWLGDKAHANSGGMYRVYEGLYEYLPKHGIELVPKEDADVLNPHIGIWDTFDDNKPMVISSHGMLWKEHGWGRIADKVNTECLAAYRRADIVTTPSHFAARAISRYTGAVPIVAHHGIDSAKWTPEKSKGYILWNKARADPASNPVDMNKLAELSPDNMFYSTHGKERDNVFVFGKITPDDMHSMVAQAGVYLALSKESGGPCFGVLEAMSCTVPVLSWDFGGTAEVVVHKETGYLAEPYNYEDLLVGLEYCKQHGDRLGENARQHVLDNYQWDTVIGGYIKAYERALNGYNDTVSVIIPCYNLSEFLPFCLDSVLEQTYKDIEIIIVNDASTDNSADIIDEYEDKDSRITVVHLPENHHVSFCRNLAVSKSSGNFILPLDADDRLLPTTIETLVKELKTNRNIDITAGKLRIYHETELEGDYHVSGWPNNASLKLQLEGYNRLPYSSLYRRKVFDRVGGYRTRIRNGVEDADFWTRALSLGYRATILDIPVLRYTHRESSLGKQNDKGSAVWLDWFPWVEDTSPARATIVSNFSPPKVSVVIPVGPGHANLVQACIDSVISQVEEDWEIVLVNDTGKPLSNLPGFIKYIDNESNRGVAYSRNIGVANASSDKVVFLDVDDTLQPSALQSLLLAHNYAGGWIYGDWYINKGDGEVEYSEADNWNYDTILSRSLCPITGVYEKKHVEMVGGFTEDILGWEDWDFHLKLLHFGICGTRLKTPLITYNMHLGWRREDNFGNRDNLLQYIKEKHYSVLKGKKDMACNSCGGKRTLTVVQKSILDKKESSMEDTVLLKYLGEEQGRNRVNSKTHKGTNYIFSASRALFRVFVGDAEFMLSYANPGGGSMFEIVKENTPQKDIQGELRVEEEPLVSQEIRAEEDPLVSQEIPAEFAPPAPIEDLDLEEHIIKKLRKGGHEFISSLIEAGDAELMAIKGVGAGRVVEIREAIAKWTQSSW